MSKYYVSGCIEIEGTVGRVEDAYAEFFTLYERKENGQSGALLDCVDALSAHAAMAVYVESDALQEQVRALAAENVALKNSMSVTLEHVSVMDTGQAGVAAMIIKDALHNSETPATDDAIREIQAQGCEMFVEFNRKLAKDYPTAMVAKALEVTELNGEQFAARIRAGEVQNV